MRRLIESGAVKGKNFVQVGLRGYWPPVETFEWMKEQGLRYHFMREIEERGAGGRHRRRDRRGARRPRLRSTSASTSTSSTRAWRPGPGTPEPGGMLTREVLRAIRQIVGAVELCGMDIVEVSPPYDHAEMTAMAANRAALEAISALAVKKQAGQARPLRALTRRRARPSSIAFHGSTPGSRRRRPSPGSTTSTCSTTRATSTSTSPWPPGPTGAILELAVGSGRLAVPLAEAGWSVTGVDLDPAMLARALTRAAAGRAGRSRRRLELVEADIAGFRLPGEPARFRLALIALNSLMLLGDRAAQAAAIATLAAHLAPGGMAVVDVWLPDADDLARYDGRVILEYAREDPETGRTVTKTGSAIHDAATADGLRSRRSSTKARPGEPPVRWVRRDRLRLVGADELRGFAEAAGLAVEILGGGYDLEPLGPGSDRAVLVATRP